MGPKNNWSSKRKFEDVGPQEVRKEITLFLRMEEVSGEKDVWRWQTNKKKTENKMREDRPRGRHVTRFISEKLARYSVS